MSEHTKTPWSTDELEHDSPYQEIEIRGADGRRICRIWMDDAPLPDYNREQRANARHIVRCVNNHERLVQAFREYRESVEASHEYRYFGFDLNQALARQEIAERKVDALLAALEAEKGGEL